MKMIKHEYHPHPAHPEDQSQKIKICTWYTPGQGYKASVIPVKIINRDWYSLEESGAFTGFNVRLFECSRRSKKTDQEAQTLISENLSRFLEAFKTPVEA